MYVLFNKLVRNKRTENYRYGILNIRTDIQDGVIKLVINNYEYVLFV